MHSRAHVAAAVRAFLVEHHQLIGVFNRQLSQQDLVDQREDRGICAYSERQRQDCDGRKKRAAAQAANRQAEIGHGCGHASGLTGLAA